MTWNPLRRSPLRPKPREKKQSMPWRREKIRLDAKGMATLRAEAFHRSEGICECGRPECLARPMNLRRVTWYDGMLHHVVSRGRGGSDTLGNVQFITRPCHEEIHGTPQWAWNRRRA